MIEQFHEIAREYECAECDYATNPAFAGAWAELWDKDAAQELTKRWEELLPKALDTMTPYWRKEYEE